MRLMNKILCVASCIILLGSFAYGATITGTVKGPDGASFKGAFVQAENSKANMMMSVLSNKQGQYRLENLPAGEYKVQIRAVGYKADPRTAVNLTADQKASFDFALQPGVVHWTDISTVQAEALLPDGPNREITMKRCWEGCHSFQHKFAPYRLTADGWRANVAAMRYEQGSFGGIGEGRMDTQFAQAVEYLATVFSPDSKLPDSPVDLPGYKQTIRPVSDDATNIVYVEYNTLGGKPPITNARMAWSAWYDEKHGQVIVPYLSGNGFGRMDLETGKVEEYFLTPPPEYTAKYGEVILHSAVVAPDGAVWFTEAGRAILGKWDPTTKKFTEYQDTVAKHTVRADSKGVLWTSGALSKFDPETGKFTHFPEVGARGTGGGAGGAYQMYVDKNDDAWFTDPGNGKIGKVDAKTGKLTQWTYSDSKFGPHRLAVDPEGVAWFNGRSDKVVRFDPKTEKFTDFPIPGPNVGTYGMGYMDGGAWYNSQWIDVLGRVDSKTGKVTEYPFPQTENGIKELLPDNHNRMWFASPDNNKFGYFYLAGRTDRPIN